MNPLLQSMGSRGMIGNFSQLAEIARMLRGGNPEQIAMNLMQKNPQFKAFIDANRGKSPEQVARENGVDLSQIMGQIR